MHGRLRVGWREVEGRLEAVWHHGPPRAGGAAPPPGQQHAGHEMTSGRAVDTATPGIRGMLALAVLSAAIDRAGVVPGGEGFGW